MPWTILYVAAAIALVAFWRGPNAVWGGLTLGLVVGGVIATIRALGPAQFSWPLIGRSVAIGVLCGVAAEVVGNFATSIRRRQQASDAHGEIGGDIEFRRHQAFYGELVTTKQYDALWSEYAAALIHYEPIRHSITESDRESLFQTIRDTNGLTAQEKLAADFALMGILDGSVPSGNALSHLNTIFGDEFVAELRAKGEAPQ
jgi:hypothetical protein